MTGHMQTGIRGLDILLGGGFLPHNAILIKGAPGTGKTTLGFQIIRNGILEYGEPGLVVSFDQFPRQFQRDMESFGWRLDDMVASGKLEMIFIAPADLIPVAAHYESKVIGRVMEAVGRTGASRVLVDSISHFKRATTDPMAQRALLMGFINEIKSMGMTPILTAELERHDTDAIDFEEYVADSVILLDMKIRPGNPIPERTVEIRKSRGQCQIGGRHPFKITDRGIDVYPHRLARPESFSDFAGRALRNVSSGVAGLDRMLQGGFSGGVASLVAGVSGTFKTTLLTQFLIDGARQDEPGLLISFQEPPSYLVPVMRRRGIALDEAVRGGRVALWHRVPKVCQLDELFHELEQEIDARGIQRVAIDCLNDFERSVADSACCTDYLLMFNDMLARRGVTTLWAEKIEHLSDRSAIGDIRSLSEFDTVVFLGYVEIESELRTVVSILKDRGARTARELRAIDCFDEGLVVSSKYLGIEGILEGSPRGHAKETIEELLQPVIATRDFFRLARRDDLPAEQRNLIYHNIDQLLGDLDHRIREHLGMEQPGE